jgi:Holliday junction resolvase
MKIKVTKASGIVEDLNLQKLRSSLTRSGADAEQIEAIIEKILGDIKPYTSTKKIYRLAQKYLKQTNHASGMRYSLKRALFRLGPSGYAFERYYGNILQQYGYDVKTGIILEGRCIKHEVDVFAENKNEILFAECKYRNTAGGTTDVKVAMYVHSRILDLKKTLKSRYPEKKVKGCLITNTRFTSEALDYARCTGIHVKSWRYPEHASLEKMIEDKRLYPVTIISGVKSGLVGKLIKENIILLKDLTEVDTRDLRKILSLPEKIAVSLKKQADELCLC